jgi:hypothetical protein
MYKYCIIVTFSPLANPLLRSIEYLLGSYGVIYGLYAAVSSSDSIGPLISDVKKVDSLLILIGHVGYMH